MNVPDEHAQPAANDLLAGLVASVPEYAILLLDPEGYIRSWNEGAERMTQYGADEVVGRHVSLLYPEEAVAEDWPAHELQIAARDGRFEDEGWRLRKGGSRFWANVTITVLRGPDGAIAGYGKVARDLTQKREAEEELRRAAGRLQAIVETAVDGIITIDERGIIETVNEATERLFGYEAAEMVGQNVDMLMPEPFHAEHDAYLHRYRRTGQRRIIGIGREVRGRRKDGSEFPLELSVSETRLESGRFFTGIVRDISERKEAEDALRRGEARLSGIIDSAMDAIITVDENQRIVVFNGAAERAFLCPAAEALGGALDRFIPARYRGAHSEHVRNFGSTGETRRSMGHPGTVVGLRSNGEEFPIEATISQVESAGHRFFTVILRDVTERLHAEKRLHQALESERQLRSEAEGVNRAKDQFLAVVSHELRTPLNAIFGYSQLMRDGIAGATSQQQRLYLERIHASSAHLLGLIEQVLLFSRSQATGVEPNAERFRVATLVRDAASLLEPEAVSRGLAFDVDVTIGEEVEATADPVMIRQILLNLLSNAVKFTESGSVRLDASIRDGRLRCAVQDSGVGIETEYLDQIFEPFWQADASLTRRVGGTGLGLSVVRLLLDAMGGTIRVQSEVGSGTVFEVEIPLDPEPSRVQGEFIA